MFPAIERLRARWSRPLRRVIATRTMLPVFAFLGFSCSPEPSTGPVELKWDREVCAHCQMVISERRYATQVRLSGNRRVYSFDDLGCAILWLDSIDERALQEAPEVWVRDPTGSRWLDAYGVRFDSGHRTPMNYGWAVAKEDARDGISFQEVTQRILESQGRRRESPRGG